VNSDDNSSDCAIDAVGLSAGYGSELVLHNVSVQADVGELLAIVGPNGAGKSTLLRLLAGSLRPRSGSILLGGQALSSFEKRALARRMAFVGQESNVAFPFTVLEVVLMGRAPHLGPFAFESIRDLEVAHYALARLNLLSLAHRYVQEISGGERKRVFLARALAQQPSVMLLDEPTAFLDLKHVAEIFGLLREMRVEKATTVIVSLHDLNVAALYADRVLLIKEGSSVAYGTPDEVLTVENLRRVYETEVYVGRNPATGAISVLPAVR
jgi:iron complex transport system ATP-binding protein